MHKELWHITSPFDLVRRYDTQSPYVHRTSHGRHGIASTCRTSTYRRCYHLTSVTNLLSPSTMTSVRYGRCISRRSVRRTNGRQSMVSTRLPLIVSSRTPARRMSGHSPGFTRCRERHPAKHKRMARFMQYPSIQAYVHYSHGTHRQRAQARSDNMTLGVLSAPASTWTR